MLNEKEADLSVLLADRDRSDGDLLEQLLVESSSTKEIIRCSSLVELKIHLTSRRFDVVLISINLLTPQEAVLLSFRAIAPFTPFIVLTHMDDTLTGIKALRGGAQEYLLKDHLTSTLLARTIRYAIERQKFLVEITKAQEDLRRSQERFELATRAAHDVIWDWDVSTDVIWWSENLKEVFGHSNGTLLNIEWRDEQIHPEDRSSVQERRNIFFGSDAAQYTLEYRFRCSDGGYSNVLERGFIVKEAGEMKRVIGALIDISERTKYEEQRLIARKVEAIVGLAGGIAHDFNNLIMSIQVNCEVLQLKLPEEFQTLPEITAIIDSAMKGATLTHQLLSFSRQQSMNPRVIEISGFTLAIKPLLDDLLGKGIRCVIETLKDPCMIRADASLLREVITVLAENAKEAMRNHGEFRIRTDKVEVDEATARQWIAMEAGQYVKMDFSDTGMGMTSEIKNRVFDPYFSTKDIGHGKGLSLASVYGIVKQNHGYIYVDSEPHKGTTFHLYFPIASEIRL